MAFFAADLLGRLDTGADCVTFDDALKFPSLFFFARFLVGFFPFRLFPALFAVASPFAALALLLLPF
jgi:hypothetical protein